MSLWPEAAVLVMPWRYSDHRPVVLKQLAFIYGPVPFKSFDSWTDMPGFNGIVTKAYEQAIVSGHPDIKFMLKLKAVKVAIKE